MEVATTGKSRVNYKLRYQTGVNDWQYTSIAFSALLTFSRPGWMVSAGNDN